jgi:3-oxoacyl-[acyl-carrier-protein] synthase-3
VVPSAWFDEQLAETFERCGVRPGLLESLAGIVERRWWPADLPYDAAAALAGQAALEAAGVAPGEVDLLLSTSVCKDHLEPSVACAVHFRLGLPSTCANLDIGNACLGFINAMDLAAAAIASGQARTVLIVDGEGSRQLQETTVARLQRPETTVADVFDNFASLTLGSGAAAMVLGGPREGGHRFLGGITRASTKSHDLCVGNLDGMRTDTAALLSEGLALGRETWDAAAEAGWGWDRCDRYVMHQVSAVHTARLCELLGVDPALVPLTYPRFGNMGPAAVPYTLSTIADDLRPGERVLLMGIGSGLNCAGAEIVW